MLALQQEAEYLRLHTRNQVSCSAYSMLKIDMRLIYASLIVCPHQEKEIGHLKSKLVTRDQQQADLQAKWNFHSFKYQLLIDMVSLP